MASSPGDKEKVTTPVLWLVSIFEIPVLCPFCWHMTYWNLMMKNGRRVEKNDLNIFFFRIKMEKKGQIIVSKLGGTKKIPEYDDFERINTL